MAIQNCMITKADMDLKADGFKTVVTIETASARGQEVNTFVFPSDKPQAKFQLSCIMDYARVDSVRKMEGRIIREVTSRDNTEVIGYGDPIKDEFIRIGADQKVQTYIEAEIKQIEGV